MLTAILLSSVCVLSLLYLCYRYAFSRPEGFPPGPPRLPLFGSYLFMMLANKKYLHKGVLKFTKWYKSDIVGFYVGKFRVVAVHNAAGIKEVLNRREFDGRPSIFLATMRAPHNELLGIFFRDGPVWKEQRRFILRYLRDFGFGRRFTELELAIQEEISDLLDLIRNGPRYSHETQLCQPGGYKVFLPHLFSPFLYNCLSHIMLNERLPRSEQAELLQLTEMAMQFLRNGDDYGKMLSIAPWIRHIFPKWSSYDALAEANKHLFEHFEKIIDYHMRSYDDGSGARNFLDLYIKQMKLEQELGRANEFNRRQFIMALLDFSLPAFTAISAQISFLIQYLLLYPDIMKRIQTEVDEVVGRGCLPTLDDRKNMHFTEAAIREGLRIETLVPSDLPHKALEDTELMGYKIPKDTIVVPSLYAYHADSRVWGDPQNFRPERFLDDETGCLSLKKDVSLPFGAGKRLCAGETFARNMLFLLTAALCQNFEFVIGPKDAPPDLSKNLNGLIITPYDFWVQLKERN